MNLRKSMSALAMTASAALAVGLASPASASAPPTPHNFYVNNVTSSSVSMQWSPGHLTEPTQWRVFQNDELVATTPGSAYTARDLTPGDTYSYRVVAVDSTGDTAEPTRTITVTARGPGIAPGSPSNLRATEVAPARVTVEFDRPGDEFDVSVYKVFDGSTPVATVGKTPYAGPTATVDVRNLEPGTVHTLTVRASRVSGLSEPSDELVVTTPPATDTVAPTVPSGLNAEIAPYTCELADLTWNQSADDTDGPGDLDYEVFVDGSLITDVRADNTASTLLPGPGGYSFTVRAVDSSGNASDHSPATTLTVGTFCRR
ncbi:fibronectin type III domain-containing protein [Glycomyces xiaoerkulensis]|uniref:fibronectin type III domain-containing protein n=1 Tax=Glycomyces xiaoerkulensis TaxID=2038139 RepID=UPI000DEEA3CD|nr:fibronectin type III domain-containing protein [Glycomyces xiaoerkulensis]